jgi:MoxR-like ATPase
MGGETRPRIPVEEAARTKKAWADGRLGGHHRNAIRYQPPAGLVDALNLAVDMSLPLLITGPPGTGKTTAAYWGALQLDVRPDAVFHETVRSEMSARDVKYEFDSVRYFRDAQVQATMASGRTNDATTAVPALPKSEYVEKNVLWRAFAASKEERVVLLFDEIDKAPRDFPNDLLHELDRREFTVPARDYGVEKVISADPDRLVLWICTSNGERELPDAFLRRCLHYRLELTSKDIKRAVESQLRALVNGLNERLTDVALLRFEEVAARVRQHKPSLAEALVWIQALHRQGVDPQALEKKDATGKVDLARLPLLGALIKHDDDWILLRSAR